MEKKKIGIILIIQLSQNQKKNRKFLIGYLDEVIKLLVLILPKMSGYTKTCLYVQMIISYQVNIKPFGLRLKT